MGRPRRLLAYIDEAGQRARTARSSDHFVMSAVVFAEEHQQTASNLLATMRDQLGRRPADTLHWQNFKHPHRIRAAQSLGESASWMTVSSVIVCKRHLTAPPLDDDTAYLYTLRYLLERLSWLARDRGRVVTYTLAHIKRFKLAKLRAYEATLTSLPDCRIDWPALDPHGGYINHPDTLEYLQLADTAASATLPAFEPDQFGNTEPRYLREMAPSLYRRPGGALTAYGLKMHPWSESTRAAYPWVAAL